MDYSKYSIANFAADDFFIQWVKYQTPLSNQFWTNWLRDNPNKQEIINEARNLVLLLAEDQDEIQEWELDEIWQNVNEARAVHQISKKPNGKPVFLRFWERRQTLVAAAIGLLILIAGIISINVRYNTPIVYATQYGEKQVLQLPDSSVVVLNANSKLTLPVSDWSSDNPREVKLKGEAYFSVSHKANNQKFIVQTSDGLQVEVLGTEFNVSDRGSRSRVVLTSGKVRVNIARTDKSRAIVLKPGELVEVKKETGKVLKKSVDTELYTAWKDDKFVVYDTSLREIAAVLEENYGFTVIFQDKALADQKVTAFLDAGSLNDILATISETLGVRITQERERKIMISNR